MTEATQVVDDRPEDEIDAVDLFNELTSGKDSSQEDSEAIDEPLGQADDDKQDDATEDEDANTSETPTDESDSEETEAQESPEEPEDDKPEDSQDDDLWSGASEAQRQAFLSLQHENLKAQNDVRANAGRVQGYSKKVNDLQNEIDKIKAEQQEASAKRAKGSEDEISLDGKSLQEIETEYPEIAQYVRHQVQQGTQTVASQFKQQLDPVTKTTQQLSGSLEEISERDQQVALSRQLDALQSAHPDYVEIRQDPGFDEWLNTRTNGVSPQIKQQLVTSMSAADNIDLLDMYKADAKRAAPVIQEQIESEEQAKPDLSEHAEIPRKKAAPSQGLPDDPIELFNLLVDQAKT